MHLERQKEKTTLFFALCGHDEKHIKINTCDKFEAIMNGNIMVVGLQPSLFKHRNWAKLDEQRASSSPMPSNLNFNQIWSVLYNN